MYSKEINSIFITHCHEPLNLTEQNLGRSYTDILSLAKEKDGAVDTVLVRLKWGLGSLKHLPKISIFLLCGPTAAPEDM